MLGGREQHAFFHQARRVTNPRDISHMRFDLKIVQVHAPENDSRVGWRRHKSQVGFHRRVQPQSLVEIGLSMVV